MNEEIRIYVACLAAYNNGYLHGEWIDATQDMDDIQEQVQAMLKASPIEEEAEEYAIHDYEGFDGYPLGEYEGLERAHELACFIEEHGSLASELLNQFGGDIEDATKAKEENYYGCYESVEDYAYELTDQTSEIPKHLENYIDYKQMAYDMELNGDIFTIEIGHGEVHIFSNH